MTTEICGALTRVALRGARSSPIPGVERACPVRFGCEAFLDARVRNEVEIGAQSRGIGARSQRITGRARLVADVRLRCERTLENLGRFEHLDLRAADDGVRH